ncbi:hypothetical protein OC842_007184, partial [Tilletia horrida]
MAAIKPMIGKAYFMVDKQRGRRGSEVSSAEDGGCRAFLRVAAIIAAFAVLNEELAGTYGAIITVDEACFLFGLLSWWSLAFRSVVTVALAATAVILKVDINIAPFADVAATKPPLKVDELALRISDLQQLLSEAKRSAPT